MNLIEHPWNAVFLAGFGTYIGIRHKFGRLTKKNENVVSRLDALEKCLLFLVIAGAMLLPVLYLFTHLLSFADYRLPGFFPWFGSVLMVGSLWLFWRSHADLGKNWSVTLQLRKQHELIKHGVYRSVRHPMYSSIWLFSIAQAMLLGNWLAGFSALATFGPMYFLRTPREEQMMSDFFGQEYRDYMGQTGRLLPRIKARKS